MIEFRRAQLDNGLQVIAECNDEAHSMAMGFFVRTGARDERPEINGVSHFLEHMAFKGTAHRTAEDVNREFDEIGSHPNAYTSDEQTVYYAAMLPEYQERGLELLADLLRPALRREDFDTEKQVIIEEIRMYDDQPPFGADDKCKAAYFGAHPLAYSVLGTVETVGGLTPEQMRAYFEQRYAPQNIVLVASGRVDFDRLLRDATARCGDWQAGRTERVTGPASPHSGLKLERRDKATQQYFVGYSPGPPVRDPRRYAAKLLATVLGDDSGSRLYWELVDPGRAEQAVLYHAAYEDTGAFVTYLSCMPELAGENLQRLYDVYRQAEHFGITAEELEQAKSKFASHLVLSSERPMRRLFAVGTKWLQQGEYRPVAEEVAAIRGVTTDEVAEVLREFPPSRWMIYGAGPLDQVPEPK